MPSRERYLFVCTNRRPDDHPKGSCGARGSEELLKALKGELLKAKLAERFRACGATCLDACELAAAVLIEPEHVLLEGVGVEDAPAIVAALESGDFASIRRPPERA